MIQRSTTILAPFLFFLQLISLSSAFLSPAPTSSSSSPTGTVTPATETQHLPRMLSAAVPMTEGSQARSIFPPPLMSFYGEQRKKLIEEQEQLQMQWANAFNDLIVAQGQELCIAGYEGYLRTGSKGAVACYCEDGDSVVSCPLVWETLEELMNDPRMDEGVKEQLTERVTSYEPDFEVAVLFAYKGQVGLNVLRPQYPPKYIFEMMKGKK